MHAIAFFLLKSVWSGQTCKLVSKNVVREGNGKYSATMCWKTELSNSDSTMWIEVPKVDSTFQVSEEYLERCLKCCFVAKNSKYDANGNGKRFQRKCLISKWFSVFISLASVCYSKPVWRATGRFSSFLLHSHGLHKSWKNKVLFLPQIVHNRQKCWLFVDQLSFPQ